MALVHKHMDHPKSFDKLFVEPKKIYVIYPESAEDVDEIKVALSNKLTLWEQELFYGDVIYFAVGANIKVFHTQNPVWCTIYETQYTSGPRVLGLIDSLRLRTYDDFARYPDNFKNIFYGRIKF